MYVYDQAPICFAGGFDDHHWTRTNDAAHLVPYLLEVTAETVQRDKGHSSVIIWDLANETQWGWGFDAQLALVREMDPTRPTIFSFDLNQLGDENPLPREARRRTGPTSAPTTTRAGTAAGRRTSTGSRSYDQPVVLDECTPAFQDMHTRPHSMPTCSRSTPACATTGSPANKPFMAALLKDRGCIGGMIWSAVDDSLRDAARPRHRRGPWAHLTRRDFARAPRHPPPVRSGLCSAAKASGGSSTRWGRPRPELWHLQKMYSPIERRRRDVRRGG